MALGAFREGSKAAANGEKRACRREGAAASPAEGRGETTTTAS
jgi:hypothetical protein